MVVRRKRSDLVEHGISSHRLHGFARAVVAFREVGPDLGVIDGCEDPRPESSVHKKRPNVDECALPYVKGVERVEQQLFGSWAETVEPEPLSENMAHLGNVH